MGVQKSKAKTNIKVWSRCHLNLERFAGRNSKRRNPTLSDRDCFLFSSDFFDTVFEKRHKFLWIIELSILSIQTVGQTPSPARPWQE